MRTAAISLSVAGLAVAGVAVLVECVCISVARSRGYRTGYEAGKRASADEFMRGVLWYAEADDQIEKTRREIWRKEIGR